MPMSATQLRQKRDSLWGDASKLNESLQELVEADDPDQDAIKDYTSRVDAKMAEAKGLDGPIQRAEQIENALNGGGKPKARELDLETEDEETRLAEVGLKKKPVVKIRPLYQYDVKNFRNDTICGMDQRERAYTMGKWLLATASKQMPGKFGHLGPNVQWIEEHLMPSEGQEVVMAAAEGGNAGVWVPDQFGTDIISLKERFGLARQVFNVLPMTSDKRTDPKEGSDPDAAWEGEATAGSDNTPTDDLQVTLTAKKLMSILMYSNELNEDAVISFADNMLTRMARKFAEKEDQAGFNGDGTSTHGGIVGVRTKLQDVDGAGTDSAGLSSTTDGTWTGITMADFHDCIGLLPDFADGGAEDNPSAAWITHRTFFYQVMHRLLLAQGGSTASEGQMRMRPQFLGWPVRFSNVYPKVAANTSVVATFGDHAMGVNLGDRRAFTLLFSEHATVGTVSVFETDQVAIRGTERLDIAVHSVGDASNAGPIVGVVTTS
jgi:HK97 family phage major capsid protein